MKIAIIGAGAMGSVFGALLSSAADIFFINYDNEHIKEISEKGLIIDRLDKTRSVYHIKIYNDYEKAAQDADAAVIFTKSYDTLKAAEIADSIVKKNGVIITLQNGIGNFEIISKTAGKTRAAAGVTSHGAYMIKPGHVRHAGAGETFIAYNKENPEVIKKITAVFNEAGIKTSAKENLDSIIWGKLVINAGINALAAILRVKNGVLGNSAECEEIMKNAALEAANVASALNIQLPFDDPLKEIKKVCFNTSDNLSSMLQDILKGKKTEIDSINSAIAKKADELGISAPYNKVLSNIIKAIEESNNIIL